MKKSTIIFLFMSLLLAFYMVAVGGMSRYAASHAMCTGFDGGAVEVVDAAKTGFVTSKAITAQTLRMMDCDTIVDLRYDKVDLADVQRQLNALDNIERAEVVRLANDRLRVRVWPMHPVARIWPEGGRSYYLNREGKRIVASARYRLDVPQISGVFDSARSELCLMPLIDALAADPDMDRYITHIDATDTTSILLVPSVRGHIIDFGSASDAQGKIERLRSFYRQVLPVKGWEYYDTISLKYDGQIVATRRHTKLPDLSVKIIEELENEGADLATMSTTNDNTNP